MLAGGVLSEEFPLVWARLFEIRKQYVGLQKNAIMTEINESNISVPARLENASI